ITQLHFYLKDNIKFTKKLTIILLIVQKE
ncbi:hypothetical protein LCGC14_2051950, partial [marine sediment metagenome]